MVSFKVLIFTLSTILAAPAENSSDSSDSSDYFFNGVFDPTLGSVFNPSPDVRALPHWGPGFSPNYFVRYPWQFRPRFGNRGPFF
jgi:hypothetical protein